MPESSFFAWSILAATFCGPIFAVLLTRFVDYRRDQHQRRLHILRTLMATRRTILAPEHIAALNLIEIEYLGKAKVIEAWKAYLRHLSTPFGPNDSDRVARERENLRVKLLSEMATILGYKIEQLDIIAGGYIPQWLVDVESEQQAIRRLFAEIAAGSKSLPIEITRLPTPLTGTGDAKR